MLGGCCWKLSEAARRLRPNVDACVDDDVQWFIELISRLPYSSMAMHISYTHTHLTYSNLKVHVLDKYEGSQSDGGDGKDGHQYEGQLIFTAVLSPAWYHDTRYK